MRRPYVRHDNRLHRQKAVPLPHPPGVSPDAYGRLDVQPGSDAGAQLTPALNTGHLAVGLHSSRFPWRSATRFGIASYSAMLAAGLRRRFGIPRRARPCVRLFSFPQHARQDRC